MAVENTESWAKRATRELAANRHHGGRARQALLDMLDSQPCARTALEIEEALRVSRRPVARASIYRILDELERLRLVQKVQVGQTMARYEPLRTGDGHHHHLVCDTCGLVTPFTDSELENAIKKLSRRVPIDVTEHEIVLRGACQDCTN